MVFEIRKEGGWSHKQKQALSNHKITHSLGTSYVTLNLSNECTQVTREKVSRHACPAESMPLCQGRESGLEIWVGYDVIVKWGNFDLGLGNAGWGPVCGTGMFQGAQ